MYANNKHPSIVNWMTTFYGKNWDSAFRHSTNWNNLKFNGYVVVRSRKLPQGIYYDYFVKCESDDTDC